MSKPSTQFFDWLAHDALPLWSTLGVDRQHGGFIERLDPKGTPISDTRRARVVARQIYAFHTAQEIGWQGPSEELVRHGLKALLDHHISADNIAIPSYIPADGRYEGGFDLYDQAFVLLGLNYAAQCLSEPSLEARAQTIVLRMRDGWQHPLGGFQEAVGIPLKANPHMHLLEAALAWSAKSSATIWRDLAKEIAELCLTHFLANETGALHEIFDNQWQICSDRQLDVVEPGHQAEWAWLLLRWDRQNKSRRSKSAALRLLQIAEGPGRSGEHLKLINELHPTLTPRWSFMRLWPQTERIKALILFAEETESHTERRHLEDRTDEAIRSLLEYFDHPIAGSWWEHIDKNGAPVSEPARASSLYHIMGAASEISRHTGLGLPT
ncbi:MAG: AGE family epimerase/isomerase [Pseudomonadota bacterium]|jgi:mannose/cellobiose epimerase-like protein (N-acyl-D-glucosamine 2-epimerase family)